MNIFTFLKERITRIDTNAIRRRTQQLIFLLLLWFCGFVVFILF